MHETPEDLKSLQDLLDATYAKAGEHTLSIHTPNWRLSAEQVVEKLTGMCVLVLATVDSDGRPFVSPVDSFFYRGRFIFGSSPTSLRARHIRNRRDVSASHVRGEELAVTVHGRAEDLKKETDWALGYKQVIADNYGEAGVDEFWMNAPYWVIEPRKMFALAPVT